MTFHDECFANAEATAYLLCKQLIPLLATIVSSPYGKEKILKSSIIEFAKDMGWEIEEDEYIGECIK